MRVTALIVDDEPIARRGLATMLSEFGWLTCVGEAANGRAALEAIERLKPDLVFLDIQMPGRFGTDLLRDLVHQPIVVFTTAHARHAVEAFELGALDYLLKPFGPDRLAAALDRVRATVGQRAANATLAGDRLRETLGSGPLRRLFVRRGGAIVPVPITEISRFEALGDYVAAYAGTQRHILHLSLHRLEERLDPARFKRIRRNMIVNLDSVRTFRRLGKDRLVAELLDGSRLEVSRNRARELRALAV